MKIQKLTIHNIASIEDATIDFAATPLSDTDIFLITGTTGAGKTTILDSICLALFNTTPRLGRCRNRRVAANADNLTADDPRNIVRLNTGEAYVVLSFEGTDGNQYEAEWHVQRGRLMRLNVQMSNVVWTLRNLTTGLELCNDRGTYSDVKQAIIQVIGMDFEQFCRTTMLAQGQFTEFLASSEADKAAILEKITNTEVFSRLGQQIYATLQAKENAYNAEKEKLEQIRLLTDEEVANINAQIASIAKQISELDAGSKDIAARLDWLKTQADDARNIRQAQSEYDALDARIKSDDFRRTTQRLQDWAETSNVREHLTEAVKAEQEMTKQQQTIHNLREVYVRCINGKAWTEQQLAQVHARLAQIQNDLNAQADYQALYENAQTITAELKQWNQLTQEISALNATLTAEQQALSRYVEAEKNARTALDQRNEAVQTLQQTIDQAKAQLPNLDMLYQQKSMVETILRLQKEITEATIRKGESEKLLADHAAGLHNRQAQLVSEEAELKRQQIAMEQRHDTVEKYARDIRAKLMVGCQCPVCLQTLQSPLPDEAELDTEFNTLKVAVEKQQQVVDRLKDAIHQLAAQQNSEQRNLQTILADLQHKQSELAAQTQSTVGADNRSLATLSPEELQGSVLNAINAKIAQGTQQQNAIAQQESYLRKLQQDRDLALRQHNEQQTLLARTEANINRTRQSTDTAVQNKITLANTLSRHHLIALPFNIDWQTDTLAFADRLMQAATQFNRLKQAKDDQERLHNGYQTLLTALPAIPADLPAEWIALEARPTENRQLKNDLDALQTQFGTANSRLTEATAQCQNHQAEVARYLAEHTEFTPAYLGELNRLSQQDYNAENQKIIQAKEQYENAGKNLQKAKEAQLQHLQSKPQTALDTDTEAMLQQLQTANRGEHDKCVEQKTLCQRQLDENEENKKKKGDTTLLEQLAAERAKWSVFKGIADSEGKTFRNVAQSMILSSLLDAANRHLQHLDSRYTLHVVDNSLNLKLEDAYQGFSTRSTGTISGGESFLVSLSLALALADFGQNLGVSTLFIDEGFGTLSGTPLNNAVNLLKSLHNQSGTQVGIISHREEIKEKIDVQIQVSPIGNAAASKVEVLSVENFG